MNDRKNGCTVALVIGILVPIVFFIIFNQINNNRQPLTTEQCLPIYGPKKAIENNDSKFRKKADTLYHHIPYFKLLDQNGDTITRSIMTNKVTVVDFFFTTCPSICIDMTSNFVKLQEKYLKDNDVLLLSYTVDPETDTVGKLKYYAAEKGVNSRMWHLLTGNKKEIYDIARFGYFVTAQKAYEGEHDFIHTEKFILIDKEGRIRGYYDGTSDEALEKLEKDIQKLLVSYIIPMKLKKDKK
ncbi:MAG: SCO family protein [Chitinophagales bacterium]|nr:SCO family protein [Chitinophagales bacterium]